MTHPLYFPTMNYRSCPAAENRKADCAPNDRAAAPARSRFRYRQLGRRVIPVLVVLAGVAFVGVTLAADDKPAAPGSAIPATPAAGDQPQGTPSENPADAAQPGKAADNAAASDKGAPLDTQQNALSMRYKRFETTLRQMAEYLRKTDPDRANLLYRAINRSQEDRIAQQMEGIIRLLGPESPQFGEAIERQDELMVYLNALLKLLQSEDRKSEIEKEKERVKALLKELQRIIALEKDARARTERGGPPPRLIEAQKNIADDTKKLEETIDRQDADRNLDASGKSSGQNNASKDGKGQQPGDKEDANKSDKKDGDKNDADKGDQEKNGKGTGDEKSAKKDDDKSKSEKSDKKEAGDKSKPSDGSQDDQSKKGKPGEKGQPGQQGQQGQQGQPGQEGSDSQQSDNPEEQQPEDSTRQNNRTPGREELEQAHQEMERAIEELKKERNQDASGKQDEAIRKLLEAKEKLEEILRQLREEERELLLAALEARFQKMLAMQMLVNAGTVNLDKTPKAEWSSRHFARARELSGQEDQIALEAAKALTLLQEEGSSIAFPEAVGQVRQDMVTVARRLEQNETAELTQAIERDIVESLQEMIEALQRELEKMKDKQQQQQQQGEPTDPSLVDKIAELKMLRTLQMRINRRTKQLGRLTQGEQATDPDVVAQYRQLSERQARVQEATYDLAAGKNR